MCHQQKPCRYARNQHKEESATTRKHRHHHHQHKSRHRRWLCTRYEDAIACGMFLLFRVSIDATHTHTIQSNLCASLCVCVYFIRKVRSELRFCEFIGSGKWDTREILLRSRFLSYFHSHADPVCSHMNKYAYRNIESVFVFHYFLV